MRTEINKWVEEHLDPHYAKLAELSSNGTDLAEKSFWLYFQLFKAKQIKEFEFSMNHTQVSTWREVLKAAEIESDWLFYHLVDIAATGYFCQVARENWFLAATLVARGGIPLDSLTTLDTALLVWLRPLWASYNPLEEHWERLEELAKPLA